jgi:1,4-dihydroxy-2-naphthoyl-CoA synthase
VTDTVCELFDPARWRAVERLDLQDTTHHRSTAPGRDRGPASLARQVGQAPARRVLRRGAERSAKDAYRTGVNRVAPQADLDRLAVDRGDPDRAPLPYRV